MKNSNLLRILLLLLAFSTVLACFVGCNDTAKKPDDTTESREETTDPEGKSDDTTEGQEETTDPEGESVYPNAPSLQIPESLDYNNAPISVLAWNSDYTDFSHQVKEKSGVAIDEAVFVRDANLSERVGVILNYSPIAAGANQVQTLSFKNFVQQAHKGGTPYDIVAGHTRCNAVCASAGYFLDLNSIADSYIETANPWWNDDMVEKISIGDSVFMITGDASASFVQMIYCVYFNADMFADDGLESPYDLVESNQWTYVKMLEMGQNFYQDLNKNKKKDLADMLPITGQYNDWPALFHGCEINYATKDGEGHIIVDPILIGDKAIDLYAEVYDAVWSKGAYVGKDENLLESFLAEKTLFWITYSGRANESFSGVTFEYGCVPMPKYNSKQADYHCAVRQPISLFSVMKGVDGARHQMISAVLEAWAYEAYTNTTPVIFKQIMQYQKSASPEMAAMLGLIRDSAYFDFVRIYSADYGVGGCDFIGNYLYAGTDWKEVTKPGGVYDTWCGVDVFD